MAILKCKKCGNEILESYYFCPNCGRKIKTPNISKSFLKQAEAYFVSLFLPPLGLYYTYRYFKNKDSISNIIAIITIIFTIISLILSLWLLNLLSNYTNQLIQTQTGGLLF